MRQNNAATGNADGALNNVLALTKVGTGSLELTGASTYSGGTIINSGIVYANNAAGAPPARGR